MKMAIITNASATLTIVPIRNPIQAETPTPADDPQYEAHARSAV
jgi:hypothetical protein